jgi:endonuclease-3
MDNKTFLFVISTLNKKYKVKMTRVRPFEVLIHGILSTRTKDETTFPAQRRLLSLAGNPQKLYSLNAKVIRKLIYPVGFYKTKTKLLKRAAKMLIGDFNGKVPSSKTDLLKIPGVGPKVASLVLVWGFGIPVIPVDTHVNRVSQRLGIVPKGTKPEATQRILESVLSPKRRLITNKTLVKFGKEICRPLSPLCGICPVYHYCEFPDKDYYKNRYRNLNKEDTYKIYR